MSVKTADGPSAFAGGADTLDNVINVVTGPVTVTSQPLALQFLSASNGNMMTLDMRPVRQVRLTARVTTVSASASTPRIALMYSPTFTVTPANFLELVEVGSLYVTLFTGADAAMQDTGWINIAPGARLDACNLGVMSVGGNGAASPVFSNLVLLTR